MADYTANFDPNLVTVTIGLGNGLQHSIKGFSKNGDFINIVRNSDVYVTDSDANGNPTRVKINDNNMTCTMILHQSSPSNDVLSTFFNIGRNISVGSFPLIYRDGNSDTFITTESAVIQSIPDLTINAGSSTDRTWVLSLARCEAFIGGTKS